VFNDNNGEPLEIEKIISSRKLEFDASVVTEAKKQLKSLEFKTLEITPRDEFVVMLLKSLRDNSPLRVKCGIDPTGTDVHLGHTIPYRKMRQFQDLGHTGVVVIGDYTAQIGDPTGKVESRPALTPEDTKKNAQKYLEQISCVLDMNRTEVRHQSEWFGSTTLLDVMNWANQTTVAKLVSHDTFKKRLEQGHSLGLHELFYPVLQGIDSVFINADVELGGSDQKFNVLMGRDYQKWKGKRPQVAVLLPIIQGTCGTQKMSKSLNNYIGVLDKPFDQFGKVMSIPDELMIEYAQFASSMSESEFLEFKKSLESGSMHPNIAKKQLASNIVAIFHGKDIGDQMKLQFEEVFKKKNVPDEIPEYSFERGASLSSIILGAKLLKSSSEVRRMVSQNAVGIVDGDKITDHSYVIDASFEGRILKIGKRKFLKLV